MRRLVLLAALALGGCAAGFAVGVSTSEGLIVEGGVTGPTAAKPPAN